MATTAPAPVITRAPGREALRAAYRQDEEACCARRLEEAALASRLHHAAEKRAIDLVAGARRRKASGLDAFLQQFGLDTEEGIALMCLAEALLRVPDARTADALIRDKLAEIDWSEHLGASSSTFVNAATFSLMLTGEVLDRPEDHQLGLAATLRRTAGRLGEPVIRRATLQAMRILGGQFVFGRTIDDALARARRDRTPGDSHSFDMLGEQAMTHRDAARYAASYEHAVDWLAGEAGQGVANSSGISVKLSALHPHYDFRHAGEAREALVPLLRRLAGKAAAADIHFTIDAEEAERLELSLDIIEELVADDSLFARPDGSAWEGFGLAVQAYQKRAVPLVDWVVDLARANGRRLFVRLVKGAYWDTEIKLSQVGGYADYPVFTRKLATDVSYLACADRMLAAPDAVRPAFATHNAYTIGAVKALAEHHRNQAFEFQRLHGMGEEVYAELARQEGNARTPVRVYAPVGQHEDLLAYLVRRLLENGANSSFVNRMADAAVPARELARDPVAELAACTPLRNPAIPLPGDLFEGRANSAGVDLADPSVREPLLGALGRLAERRWEAAPSFADGAGGQVAISSPQDPRAIVGTMRPATGAAVTAAISRAAAAFPAWSARSVGERAAMLDRAASLFEEEREALLSLCLREGGKTLPDAVLELREAVDFLRYYAGETRRLMAGPMALPGPTGEENTLRLAGRGVFAAIAPWNFPLAIFTGTVAAPLVAGNTVLAKPAEQTPLIAAEAIRLMHAAGVPADVLQLLPGGGEVGAALTADERLSGVVFTGSTSTARLINRSLAARDGPIGTLVAETGGQNAMIVDSSALPEQVTRDVVASAFQSAGQRCSALRVLYLQEDVANRMLTMIRGAFEALHVGDPADLATDVGPVIDDEAKAALDAHVERMRVAGYKVWRRELGAHCRAGHYVAPTIIEIPALDVLEDENFGPVLHVVRFRGEELDKVIEAINASGFGLTLGLHSRIEGVSRFVERRARVGNLYVNRNQIGAVVGSQPFGGEGLSGTGPKAGGPHYLLRFVTERVTTVDTTAAGGNASLLAS
jgi:RHH-type proline utilization regulon transcriptional repressor/proline dehydrogenase/delta 1-pyrroline-5-carboxylate dehydrogenase